MCNFEVREKQSTITKELIIAFFFSEDVLL